MGGQSSFLYSSWWPSWQHLVSHAEKTKEEQANMLPNSSVRFSFLHEPFNVHRGVYTSTSKTTTQCTPRSFSKTSAFVMLHCLGILHDTVEGYLNKKKSEQNVFQGYTMVAPLTGLISQIPNIPQGTPWLHHRLVWSAEFPISLSRSNQCHCDAIATEIQSWYNPWDFWLQKLTMNTGYTFLKRNMLGDGGNILTNKYFGDQYH
jgi:hypothetical protein